MLEGNWRDRIWNGLDNPWDVIVIGGGITGAGIFRESTRLGLKTLLVEQRDFGWGTSSRSSKLIHGGLRYLKEAKLLLTRSLVLERERLLVEGPGLIVPLGFLLATYRGDFPGRWASNMGLVLYDLLGLTWSHRHYNRADFRMLAPHLSQEGLTGGFSYRDAATDDARLTLRLIFEALADGGMAMNYVAAEDLLHKDGQVIGVRLRDRFQNRAAEARAKVVINATGIWADKLRAQVGGKGRIRLFRGSHLIFPSWRLPVAQAVSFQHPVDRRFVYALPWEGATLLGTTDVDHTRPLEDEPSISPNEVAYLMSALEARFPSLNLGLDDVICSFAGVRAVIEAHKALPSRDSREYVVWEENGLITVTGGKLTNFRLIASSALKRLHHRLPDLPPLGRDVPALDPIKAELPDTVHLNRMTRSRLVGRYGVNAPALVVTARPDDLKPIPGTQIMWTELRWGARCEGVIHLDDLLLRRLRLGLLLPQGARGILPQIRAVCQPELHWDDGRWEEEESNYLDLWHRCYSLPDPVKIPDWRGMQAKVRARSSKS